MAYLRIKAMSVNISLINVYAQSGYTAEEKNYQMYQNVEQELDLLPEYHTSLFLGDSNTQVGK